MNIHRNTELLDRLASHYALGSLRGGARRRFEALAREHASVRAAALIWQTRLSSLTELQSPEPPSPLVWTRIDNMGRGEQDAAAMKATRETALAAAAQAGGKGFFAGGSTPTRGSAAGGTPGNTGPGFGWWHNLLLWRGASAAGAVATVAAIAVGAHLREQTRDDVTAQVTAKVSAEVNASTTQRVSQQLGAKYGGEVAALQARLAASAQIEYVAVLADKKAGASMLVTFDPVNNKLTLQRVGNYQEASDRSLQLWALPPQGGPRSLGVLGSEKLLKLTAQSSDVREVPTLAISLEPKGGVPSEKGPTGPVLFTGALIQKML